MRDWKYKIHNLQKKTVRIVASAACVLGVLAVCLGVVGYRNSIKAEEEEVTEHRVINTLAQIPDTKKHMYDKNESTYELGTEENPFLLLEIVPYEEYAEFGYHISGCEPINIDRVPSVKLNEYSNSLNTATVVKQASAYFFSDEPEVTSGRCNDDKGTSDLKPVDANSINANGYQGYYKKVEEGKGHFIQDENGAFIKKDGGDIIWHTLCQYEKENVYKDVKFESADSEHALLTSIEDDPIFTVRFSTDDDPVKMTYNYYYYKNNDNFLKDTLKLNDTQADEFWISIKTITPGELNKNPEWVEYADMYIVTNTGHVGVLTQAWENYNRLGHTATPEGERVNTFEGERDITWAVARKMYDKITADNNYAALVVDDRVYTYNSGLKYSVKNTKNIDVYDMNLNKTSYTYRVSGKSNNNLYKLMVMLFSMDSKWFKSIFLNDENPLIDDQGRLLLQEDPENQEYWSEYSFILYDPTSKQEVWNYMSDSQKTLWKRFGTMANMSANDWKSSVTERVYTFSGDRSTVQDYLTKGFDTSKEDYKFTDFKEAFQKENPDSAGKASSSDIVRYILGYRSKNSEKIKGNIRILDLEPCYDSKNGWPLQENYFRFVIPNFYGTISLTHMTTAEFNGSTEDLNNSYDMIYMGLDTGAYNTKEMEIKNPDTDQKEKDFFTIFNDYNMNGKIYFHTGDKMNASEYARNADGYVENRSVKFVNGASDTDTTLRFSGNDITYLKQRELEKFLVGGHFITAVPYLYQTDKIRIDQTSYICKFIQKQKEKKTAVYVTTDADHIYEELKKDHPSVTFATLPQKYEATVTSTDDSATITGTKYLTRDSKERPTLPFAFYLTDSDKSHQYRCHIYIDQNQDGKFDDSEIFYDGKKNYTYSEAMSKNEVTIKLSKYYAGVVNWKIEVYQKGNEQIHFVESGCSLIDKLAGTSETSVRVLQIIPESSKGDKFNGWLNLTSGGGSGLNADTNKNKNKLFNKYYDALKSAYNYNVQVTVMTLDDYLTLFDESNDGPFEYNYSEPVSESNPSKMPAKVENLYNSYDMMIIGFGDTYYHRDFRNDKGAVDFIKYFIAQGKSVLFTHDLTSMHNVDENDFGFVTNKLLRDVMGMNRYGMISTQLDNKWVKRKNDDSNQVEKMKKYQENKVYYTYKDDYGKTLSNPEKHSVYESLTYEDKTYPQTQGFTYYAMKRLGWTMNTKIEPSSENEEEKKYFDDRWSSYYSNGALQIMPYRYMIFNSKTGKTLYQASDDAGKANETGFNDTNDLTSVAEKTASGQITEYPFKISDSLPISNTHGQWYQLNMEDPELTVWYCLGDDGKRLNELQWNQITNVTSSDNGTASTYGVSPKDAANNYYIYSKGNVFYSGVGHSEVTGDMEARLFINTMIAAYHASNHSPMVEILNEEATNTKWDMQNSVAEYDMTSLEEYSQENAANTNSNVSMDAANEGKGQDNDEYVKIKFSPVELAVSSLGMKCRIYYGNDKSKQIKYIYHVVDEDDGTKKAQELKADTSGYFNDDINNMDEYYFYYPKAYLEDSSRNKITFEIKNAKNKEDECGTTTVDLSMKMLFLLD